MSINMLSAQRLFFGPGAGNFGADSLARVKNAVL